MTRAELETWLADRFGDVFPSRREAAAVVREAIERWG
jgi:hypothetical protein